MSPAKLVVELTSLCNLDCDYCFKEAGATHLDPGLLGRILADARAAGASKLTYTGGEVALYPWLDEAIARAASLGYRYALVTNGWHFPRIVAPIVETRAALEHVFFSVDGASEEAHDRVRGRGAFGRLMGALSVCRLHALPFSLLVVVNRRTRGDMERLAIFAARLGAAGIRFGHMLPTSAAIDAELSLSPEERLAAERESRALAAILRIPVTFSASASHRAPGPPCDALAGETVTIDCRGRMSLCCQLADFRGSAGGADVVADLGETSFAEACSRFLALAAAQRARRDRALAEGAPGAEFPCHFCAATLGKSEWRAAPLIAAAARKEHGS